LSRVVLDPNVLISAFISQRGSAPDRIVRAWREGAFELVISPTLIGELSEVLRRPRFARQAADGRAEIYVAAIADDAIRVEDPPSIPRISPDPDDDYLFAIAGAAGADVIVSGDSHLTELTGTVPPVLTPRQFAERLG
jgi:uncharacterized protein